MVHLSGAILSRHLLMLNRRTKPRTDGARASDDQALEGLRSLDPQALASVHTRYFPELYRYAHYRLGDMGLGEDLASEALTRMLDALQSGRGPKSNLRGWLFATLGNLIMDHLRRKYSRRQVPLHESTATLVDQDFTQQSDVSRELRLALRSLTAAQQHVISLRFGSGYSLEETAAILQKKPNAIKALQFRAIAALRRELTGDAHDA